MAEDNRIRMPSGQGGLVRYSEEAGSKLELSPGAVIVFAVLIFLGLALLHYFGKGLFS